MKRRLSKWLRWLFQESPLACVFGGLFLLLLMVFYPLGLVVFIISDLIRDAFFLPRCPCCGRKGLRMIEHGDPKFRRALKHGERSYGWGWCRLCKTQFAYWENESITAISRDDPRYLLEDKPSKH